MNSEGESKLTQPIPDNAMDVKIGTLRAQGASIRDISASVGLSINAVHHRVHKPDLKRFIQNLSEQLARQTGETLLENHRLALDAANRAWQEIARQETPEDAAKLATANKDLLELADKKEKRAGQAMGIFASPTPSIFLQQIFTGPSQVVLSANVMQMFGNATRQIIQTQDPGDEEDDIIDLDET